MQNDEKNPADKIVGSTDGLGDSARLDWLEQRAWNGAEECLNLIDDWRTPDGKRHSAGLRAAIDSMMFL